ncbi:MAG: DMT family transporter [Paracoccus sp. (in: a-proteobacteria)]|uniref:DMT family transporter n=2 Tax=Paracoccus TaxID=265 RepID=UPI0025DEB061|nr:MULTISPECIES: DMT family transporter [unclassified Paracoccus (in: a-proteobacteria)]MCS5601048.1 DMT family transporter [Paracoccus sp. (in: a-proteobacteria)]
MKPPQAPLPPGQMAISARMESEDWALLLLLSLLWGGSFFLISIALTGLPVLTIVALRLLVAALVLWAIVAATGRRLPRDPAIWRAFLVMGVLNNAIPFSLIVWGQTEIPSGLASILNATTPLWTVLVTAALLADERASPRKIAGVVLGLGGVAVMIGLDALAGLGQAIWPQLAILGAAISYAFANSFGRRFRRGGVDPVVTAAGMVTGSGAVLIPLALAIEGLPGSASAQAWLAVLTLGVAGTGLAYVLYFRILGRAGATNISLVTFLVPVSAILLGWLFLGETLGIAHLLGMGLIAAGLALIDGRLIGARG